MRGEGEEWAKKRAEFTSLKTPHRCALNLSNSSLVSRLVRASHPFGSSMSGRGRLRIAVNSSNCPLNCIALPASSRTLGSSDMSCLTSVGIRPCASATSTKEMREMEIAQVMGHQIEGVDG